MVIKASSAQEIRRLIAALSSSSLIERESAIARLAIIGARAVDQLTGIAMCGAPAEVRIAGLRALEGIPDARRIEAAARAAEESHPGISAAAIAVLRAHLRSKSRTAAIALDRLATLALDSARPEPVRIAAIEALGDVPTAIIAPLLAELGDDVSPAVRQRAKATGSVPETPSELTSAPLRLEDDPAATRALLRAAQGASLTELHRLLADVRAREESEPAGARRAEWRVARGMIHQALADRGSRIALYDLREALEHSRDPLPVGFLSAVAKIGDGSCLEPLAASYVVARQEKRDWWAHHLADTFRTIATREGLTRRHAVVKRIAGRWPDTVRELLGTHR
ncbi:MAG: hypothetical protein HYX76_02925 [Acidobacteria bacterium]|nr:hypothetical protein [Acidobacteriota bacterium]